MNLPEATANFVRGPKGEDIAVEFGDVISLSFWDLWCLIVVREKFEDCFEDARNLLAEKIASRSMLNFFEINDLRDLHHLLEDLESRVESIGTPSAILEKVPEKLIKKEMAKAKTIILEAGGSNHARSAQMLQAPYRLLKTEAYRGEWDRLPVNPDIYVNHFIEILTPYGKRGYIPADATFKLVGRLEKKIQSTLKKIETSSNSRNHRFAMFRCLVTLYHERSCWDDSYGNMGGFGQECIQEILKETPESQSCDPKIYLKDILMFYCWENHGLIPCEWIDDYVTNKISNEEKHLASLILNDIENRATAAFCPYNAKSAKRLRNKIQEKSKFISIKPSHLTLVK